VGGDEMDLEIGDRVLVVSDPINTMGIRTGEKIGFVRDVNGDGYMILVNVPTAENARTGKLSAHSDWWFFREQLRRMEEE
jgi:hypothetical protein